MLLFHVPNRHPGIQYPKNLYKSLKVHKKFHDFHQVTKHIDILMNTKDESSI